MHITGLNFEKQNSKFLKKGSGTVSHYCHFEHFLQSLQENLKIQQLLNLVLEETLQQVSGPEQYCSRVTIHTVSVIYPMVGTYFGELKLPTTIHIKVLSGILYNLSCHNNVIYGNKRTHKA